MVCGHHRSARIEEAHELSILLYSFCKAGALFDEYEVVSRPAVARDTCARMRYGTYIATFAGRLS